MSNMQNTAHSFEDTGKLQLLEGSIAFFPSLIAAIDNAMESVQMETYIFDLTASGAHIAAALERAAQRGVVFIFLLPKYRRSRRRNQVCKIFSFAAAIRIA